MFKVWTPCANGVYIIRKYEVGPMPHAVCVEKHFTEKFNGIFQLQESSSGFVLLRGSSLDTKGKLVLM